jgi:hypothetical protein
VWVVTDPLDTLFLHVFKLSYAGVFEDSILLGYDAM